MSEPPPSRIVIEIADRQNVMSVREEPLREAVRRILADADIFEGEISIALVNNAEIHEINRRFLQHDYPTDVISFPLEFEAGRLEGEIVASTEMAASTAPEHGWDAAAELLLYVIHGALHLVGHDDHDPDLEPRMRAAERQYLGELGVALSAESGAGAQGAASASSSQMEQ